MSEDITFYGRDGQQITRAEWAARFAVAGERIMVSTPLRHGRAIVTIWHGMMYPEAGFHPFSSWMQNEGDFDSRALDSYDHPYDAIAGHGDLVAHIGEQFFCPVCHFSSSNPEDLRHGYCGHCHANTGPTMEERPHFRRRR